MLCTHILYQNFKLFFSQMVPIKEMTDVLKVVKETAVLKPKSWVRLKRGVFKDDLAQVNISAGNLYQNQSI